MSSFVADVVVSVAASAVGALGLAEGGLAATALTGAIEGSAIGGVFGGMTGGMKGLISGLEGGFVTGGITAGLVGALGSTAPVLDASGNVVTQGTGIFAPNASTGLTGTGGVSGGTGLTGGSATTTFGADGAPSTTFGAGSGSGLQVGAAGGTNVANPWSLTGGTGAAAPGALTTVGADGSTITAAGSGSAGAGATAAAPQSLSQKLASFATPKNILSVGTDLYSMEQGKALQQQAAALAKQQDPFASQRAQYAAQLSALEANPSSLTSTPGYQAGIQSLQRSQAASGTLSSGNAQADLVNYGSNAYNQQVQTLAGLAGAGATPGAGAATALTGSSMAAKANVSAGLNLASLTGGSSNDTSYLAQLMQAKLLG